MKQSKKCSICGQQYIGHGHNSIPVNNGKCCDKCNYKKVVPKRITDYFERKDNG